MSITNVTHTDPQTPHVNRLRKGDEIHPDFSRREMQHYAQNVLRRVTGVYNGRVNYTRTRPFPADGPDILDGLSIERAEEYIRTGVWRIAPVFVDVIRLPDGI